MLVLLCLVSWLGFFFLGVGGGGGGGIPCEKHMDQLRI